KTTIPAGSSSARVAVTLLSDAGRKEEVVKIQAQAGKLSSTAELRVNVEGGGGSGNGDKPFLPRGYAPDGDDAVEVRGRKLYKAVRSDQPGLPPARFVLVYPKNADAGWAPFYLMRSRASNAQFRDFDRAWPKDDDLPAVGMPAARAQAFAAALGGR